MTKPGIHETGKDVVLITLSAGMKFLRRLILWTTASQNSRKGLMCLLCYIKPLYVVDGSDKLCVLFKS